MNKVILVGNLGKDADFRQTPSGKELAEFNLATKGYKDTTDWHRCVFWEPKGVAAYLKKGQMVSIDGSLRQSSYEKDGRKVYKTEVVVRYLELVGRKADPAPHSGGQSARAPRHVEARPSEDEIPF